jgi:hypothetical protein
MMIWLRVFFFLGGFILLIGGMFVTMSTIRTMTKVKEQEVMIKCLEKHSLNTCNELLNKE